MPGRPLRARDQPDRTVHVFAAYPEAEPARAEQLAGRARTRAGGDPRQGAQGQAVTRLGDTTEFAYIRTLMPRGAAEEDGFIYLSDPFIRRLVGPAGEADRAPPHALLQPSADDRPRQPAVSHGARPRPPIAGENWTRPDARRASSARAS